MNERSTNIIFRVNDYEKSLFFDAAEATGKSLSEMLRTVMTDVSVGILSDKRDSRAAEHKRRIRSAIMAASNGADAGGA